MVTEDRPTGYFGITRQCIAEYYSMGRTRGTAQEVLVDCSWNQSRNTWKYENGVPVVFRKLEALKILPGVERDGVAQSPYSISFPLISIRDQLTNTSIYHLFHTVCCSEARGLSLGCCKHLIFLRITDLIPHRGQQGRTRGHDSASSWNARARFSPGEKAENILI